MLPFMSIMTVAFLLQGCFCKECISGVSQRKPDPGKTRDYSERDQGKTPPVYAERSAVETTPQVIVDASQEPDGNKVGLVENVFTTQSEIPNAGNFSSEVKVEKEFQITPAIISNHNRGEIDIEKIIPAKVMAGKSCPFGIRSISSQIIAGPNISFKNSDDVYGSNYHKHQPGAGFQVGMGSNLVFSDKFSVSPSLLLKHNTASEKITYQSYEPGGGDPGITKDKYSYTYLSAPVVANYHVGKQVQLFAGPELNYLVRASVKKERSTGSDDKDKITKNSVKLGVGVQAGVKYRIPSGNGDSPFGVQLLYEHRLSRLNKKNPDGYNAYDSPAWNMKGFQLGVTCAICELMKGK